MKTRNCVGDARDAKTRNEGMNEKFLVLLDNITVSLDKERRRADDSERSPECRNRMMSDSGKMFSM